MPIDEHTAKELLRLEKAMIDNHARGNQLAHNVLDSLATLGTDIHYIKQSLSKDKLITYGIIAVSCILFGTQYKIWLPYANEIATTIKEAKDIRGKHDIDI